ncbi:MAG TPA: hypothetical protein VJ865_17085 [Gemmatimonadaceae bacterium]|nr:hypothetical protein [Gemmatimonadaceae bacterium]
MRLKTFFVKTVSALVILGLSACGSDDAVSPPPRPHFTLIAGDEQTGTTGQPLDDPLIIRITHDDGTPVVGEEVDWAVTSGGGSFSETTSHTDADGKASTTWTLGDVRGDQSAAALVRRFTAAIVFKAMAYGPTPPPGGGTPPLSGAILHYDGSTWSLPQQTEGKLNTVWGASSTLIFAAGKSQCGGSVFLTYNGSSWDTPPSSGCGFSGIASISGSSASNVYLVGNSNMPMQISGGVSRFDGTSWTGAYGHSCSLMNGRCDPFLNAVWTPGPSEAVVVGDSGFIARYDGTSWSPNPSGTFNHLRGVWGATTGSPRVFAVGDAGTIVAFDGSAWHAQASGFTGTLNAVWGTSPNDVFAVGAFGTILHYDGSAWSVQHAGGATLRGIWGSSATSVFAVGDDRTIFHFDGTSWTQQTVSTPIDLHGVWGSSATDVYAVGYPN